MNEFDEAAKLLKDAIRHPTCDYNETDQAYDYIMRLARLGAAVEERCAYSLDVLAHDGNIGLIAKQQIGEDVLSILTSSKSMMPAAAEKAAEE